MIWICKEKCYLFLTYFERFTYIYVSGNPMMHNSKNKICTENDFLFPLNFTFYTDTIIIVLILLFQNPTIYIEAWCSLDLA